MELPLLKLLLVEDDEEDYLIVREILSKTRGNRFVLVWAPTYEAGLEQVEQEVFAAILVDYSLQRRTGLEFIQEVAARGDQTPMIFLTGQGNYEIDLQAMQAGAADFLTKNEINPPLLERSIRYAMERKRVANERERLVDEIKSMTQQLWHTAKLATMGELAASLAHELNNPLAIMSLRIESLLAYAPETCSEHHELEVIQGEVDRMARLVANLLETSRSEQRQITIVNIGEEIRKTVELMQTHLVDQNIVVQMEIPDEDCLVDANLQQMRQLFLNLFTNARDAMPDGGRLTIHLQASGNLEQIVIEIQDTGVGIRPEDLTSVMTPFFSTKPEGKGTGLGLAICRRIVEEHHGSIRISSPGLGKGATVQITLPHKAP